mmetsp:Transcript_51696/g.57759  ORF Transcript_51696/g.57759 Transcript_51696/m.57759 type:complete len:111 (-) Transcript_51696:120-452(-)
MCTTGPIPPPTSAPVVQPSTQAHAPVSTTSSVVVAQPVTVVLAVPEPTSLLALNNNVPPRCYVASVTADGTTYTSNDSEKVLPNTGESCYVPSYLDKFIGNIICQEPYQY